MIPGAAGIEHYGRGGMGRQMTRMNPGAVAGIAMVMIGIFVATALPGCGVKSAPIPPEYARPERILSLRAAAAAGGIKLTWQRPSHYTSGHSMRDLGGFVLMRAEGDGPMTALVKIPVTDQERFQVEDEFTYLDRETRISDRYRYAVIAETSDGYHSEASNEVEFTRIKPPAPPNPDTYQLPAPSSTPTVTP
jgi:hypothetical protein